MLSKYKVKYSTVFKKIRFKNSKYSFNNFEVNEQIHCDL